MKRWRVIALVCTILACATLMLAGCNSESYSPAAKDQTVTDSALGKSGTLRVGVNTSAAPLAGQTQSDSRIVGIDVDVAAYMADQMGLKVDVVDVGNNPESALSDGQVDVVLGVLVSDAEDADFWKSEPYLATGVALFGTAAESAVPTTDSNPKIAAQASSKSSWQVTTLFGDGSLVQQDDPKATFAALNSGAARYAASDAIVGTYAAKTSEYDDKIVALLQDPTGYCAAVSKSNTELQSAVASAVNELANKGVMDIIESKWLGAPLDLDKITVIKAGSSESTSESSSAASESAASAEAAASGEAAAPAEGEQAAEQAAPAE